MNMESLSRHIRFLIDRKPIALALAWVVFFCVATTAVAEEGWPLSQESQPSRPAIELLSNDLPLYFIENAGQTDERVAYYVQGRTTSIYFTKQGLTYSLRDPLAGSPGRWVLKQDFIGADFKMPRAEDPTPTTMSYFKGPRTQWKAGLKTFNTIAYRDLWPGIDLSYSGRVNELKHSFVVRPGADPSRIRMRMTRSAGSSCTPSAKIPTRQTT